MAKIRQQNEFEYQQQQIQPYEKVLEKTKEVPLSDEPYFDKSVSHNVTVAENQTANLVCRPMNTGKKSVSTSKQQPYLLGYPPPPRVEQQNHIQTIELVRSSTALYSLVHGLVWAMVWFVRFRIVRIVVHTSLISITIKLLLLYILFAQNRWFGCDTVTSTYCP